MHNSVWNPAAAEAARLLWLCDARVYVCAFLLAVATTPLVSILIRYRRRNSAEPDQITGNRNMEIACTVPLGVVGFSLRLVAARGVDCPVRMAADFLTQSGSLRASRWERCNTQRFSAWRGNRKGIAYV